MIGTKPEITSVFSQYDGLDSSVVVACPDARPPAYELVRGLADRGLLQSFVTGYYDKPSLLRGLVPKLGHRGRSLAESLARRKIDGVDESKIRTDLVYDLSIRLENRVSDGLRASLARHRTERFDRKTARLMPVFAARGSKVALFFSDVGSRHAMLAAKKAGMKVVLSMVTGHMDEEMEILDREKTRSPEFFPAYLGDGSLNIHELKWLHDRRRLDLNTADLVLVPSRHIAREVMRRSQVPSDRVRVIPYAADPSRFEPRHDQTSVHPRICRFLFAGGISQRKGLSDLIEAWRRIRRPGWTLSLAGAAPESARKLIPADDPSLHVLGKISYPDMPRVMADHEVFVFPSLFEGSAVVCYEAMASGLAVITTPQAGSVVRDGEEGLVVPAADPEKLAMAMKQLGEDFELRQDMGESARIRALDFTWDHYRDRTISEIADLVGQGTAAAVQLSGRPL